MRKQSLTTSNYFETAALSSAQFTTGCRCPSSQACSTSSSGQTRVYVAVNGAETQIALSQIAWKYSVDRCRNFPDRVHSHRTVPDRMDIHAMLAAAHSDNALNVQLLHFPDFNPDPKWTISAVWIHGTHGAEEYRGSHKVLHRELSWRLPGLASPRRLRDGTIRWVSL